MTPELWQQVRPVLESALELDPDSRKAFLNRMCEDPLIRSEVESLISCHVRAGTSVLSPRLALDWNVTEDTLIRLRSGSRIGRYEIIDEIAVGGMGAVYRAVRADGEYKQAVALKIMRTEFSSALTDVRFKNERQILASLDHSNIAKILDGGTTADGVPYFVMELIDGVPITDYCDQHGHSIDQRLELFLTVCSAVSSAHQHLVIHRDIKPSNILVTADGVAKLLDFGIAKVLDANLLPEATATGAEIWLMTPEYASPEQFLGQAVTTATDVYSLGMVLYQLLTGRHAYRFANRMPLEIARTVLETEPDKPSSSKWWGKTSDGGNQEETSAVARASVQRGFSAEKLQRRLAGDLDNIVLKAIAKSPQQRYSSVERLSDDLRRHMKGLPVQARPSTLGYRVRKFISRHKTGATAAALIFLSVLTGFVLTVREARIARANEMRAEQRFNDVRKLAKALIFDVHDSIKDLPGSTPARKIVIDNALQYLDSLTRESGHDLSLQRELATAYEKVGLVQGHHLQNNLGDTQGSLNSYQKALEIRQQIRQRSSDWNDLLALAESLRLVAHQQWAVSAGDSARENIKSAVAISEALNREHPNDLNILRDLSSIYGSAAEVENSGHREDFGKMQEDLRKKTAIDESLLRINPDDLEAKYAYAQDLRHRGDLAKADSNEGLAFYERELEIMKSLHQRSSDVRYARGVAFAYGDLASEYENLKDYKRGLECDLQCLGIYQELNRVDPKNILFQRGLAIAYGNTATRLSETGNISLSMTYMKKAVETMRALVAASPENALQRHTLGEMYMASGSALIRAGRSQAALKQFIEGLAIFKSFYGGDPKDARGAITVAACVQRMGTAAAKAGQTQLAEGYFHQALGVAEPLLQSSSGDLETDLDAKYTAADAYSGMGDIRVQAARRSGQDEAGSKRNWKEARSWYLKSLETWRRIEHPARNAPSGFGVGDPALVAKNLQLCESAIASLN